MLNNHPYLFLNLINLRYVDMVVFRIFLKALLKRVQNDGKKRLFLTE